MMTGPFLADGFSVLFSNEHSSVSFQALVFFATLLDSQLPVADLPQPLRC